MCIDSSTPFNSRADNYCTFSRGRSDPIKHTSPLLIVRSGGGVPGVAPRIGFEWAVLPGLFGRAAGSGLRVERRVREAQDMLFSLASWKKSAGKGAEDSASVSARGADKEA